MQPHIDILANLLIQQYFLNYRCLLVFTDQQNPFNYHGDIPLVQIQIQDDSLQENLIFQSFGCQGVIIASNKPAWTIQTFEELVRHNLERFNSRRYLVLPGNNVEKNITDIFDLEEILYISDLLIIEKNSWKKRKVGGVSFFMDEDNIVYDLWTHQYVGSTDNKKKLFLDSWYSETNQFKFNNDLYPNKLRNQMGRPLRMATFQYEPFTIIGDTEEDYKGSELLTAMAYVKHYNMTYKLVINTEDYWGELFPNWTGNGLLGNVLADRADVGFDALYQWEIDHYYLDLSTPLTRSGVTCLVPAPKLAAGWLTPLYSFSFQMWIATGITFLMTLPILSTMHYFYNKIKNVQIRSRSFKSYTTGLFRSSIFSIFKVFVLQGVADEEIPISLNGSFFMGLLYLFSLCLSSSYSSGLASIMTVPRYENPINTVDEFVASGLHWGATQKAWTYFIKDIDQYNYRMLVERFVVASEEDLRELSKSGEFAFVLERLPNRDYAVGTFIKKDVIESLHLMDTDFYYTQCVFMVKKSSILLPSMDMFILRVFSAGLIGYWQSEAVTLYMDSDIQKAMKYHSKDAPLVKLKWTHVQGSFALLCMGHLISTAVFLFEIFLSKYKKQTQN